MNKEKEIKGLKSVADYWYKKCKRLSEENKRLQTFKDNARCRVHGCCGKAEHSDGNALFCFECWDSIEEVA